MENINKFRENLDYFMQDPFLQAGFGMKYSYHYHDDVVSKRNLEEKDIEEGFLFAKDVDFKHLDENDEYNETLLKIGRIASGYADEDYVVPTFLPNYYELAYYVVGMDSFYKSNPGELDLVLDVALHKFDSDVEKKKIITCYKELLKEYKHNNEQSGPRKVIN
jgi:hypothetical protein